LGVPKEDETLEKGAKLDPNAPDDASMLPGTLVWAKAKTYPWWPAVVFDERDKDVPKRVLQERRMELQSRRSNAPPLHLVKFFDKQKSWQFLDVAKLKLLGEDPALDQDLINPTSRAQRFKKGVVHECRDAFRAAIAEMDMEEKSNSEVDGQTADEIHDGDGSDGNQGE